MEELKRDVLTGLLETMLRIRLFEERIVELYPAQEMMTPVHLCIGQEAIAAGTVAHLTKQDYLFSTHRAHGHCLAKGTSMKALMAEFYGRQDGCSKGKGGSMHIVDIDRGILGTTAIVGGGIPIGVGAALASAIRGDGRITVVFFGDGAVDEGAFYESMNFASLKSLPVVFVCENNSYATNSPHTARHPTCKIAATGPSYAVPGFCVDGNDVVEVYKVAKDAIERARAGDGPTLIEALTYRWKGHVGPEADHEKGCRPKAELLEWMEKCPIKALQSRLMEKGITDEQEIKKLEANIAAEIDEAVRFGKSSPWPDKAALLTDLYAETEKRN